jgi:hypothetical protein
MKSILRSQVKTYPLSSYKSNPSLSCQYYLLVHYRMHVNHNLLWHVSEHKTYDLAGRDLMPYHKDCSDGINCDTSTPISASKIGSPASHSDPSSDTKQLIKKLF